MTDATSPIGDAGAHPIGKPPADWRRRGIIGLGVLVLAAVLYVFATSFLPRWWAHRIGGRVGGSFAAGIVAGLLLGGVLTLLALVVARFAIRRRATWRRRGLLALGAVLLAAPNLTTLGIVIGNGGAAHAGERTLDVEAPGFRGATLIGAIVGVASFIGLQYLLVSRRRQRREVGRLRDELRGRDAPGPSPA